MVSLIVVDYGSLEKTIQYIESCARNIKMKKELHSIIVDNWENTSENLSYLQERYKENLTAFEISGILGTVWRIYDGNQTILYVQTGKNCGYAKGNNLGAKISESYYQDDFYLFSNNDLEFTEEISIESFIEPFRQDNKIGAAGPCVLGTDGKAQSPRRYVHALDKLFLYYWNLLLPKKWKWEHLEDVIPATKNQYCYWVTGSFFMVEARKFREAGGFDENTFLYCEEIILSERLLKKGYKMYYIHDIKLIHQHGQTVQSSMNVLKSIRISFESSLYYFRNYRNLPLWVSIAAKIHYQLFAILFRCKKAIGRGTSNKNARKQG